MDHNSIIEQISSRRNRPRFPSVASELLRTAEGRLDPAHLAAVDAFVQCSLTDKSMQGADFIAETMKWAIRRELFIKRLLPRKVREISAWWAQSQVIASIRNESLPAPSVPDFFNEHLQSPVSDVAIASAVHIARNDVAVSIKSKDLTRSSACILESFGILKPGLVRACGVKKFFEHVLQGEKCSINWKKFLKSNHRRVELQAVWCKALWQTDMTAWVNAMDVFNDFILYALCKLDTALPPYELGHIGSILSCSHLRCVYPKTQVMLDDVHQKRRESALSHPIETKGTAGRGAGRVVVGPTGKIKFSYSYRARKLIRDSIHELAAKIG